MAENPVVQYQSIPPAVRITINRPEKLNALNAEVIAELGRSILRAGEDPEVRVLILSGAGTKAFIAGADIAGMSTLTPVQAREFSRQGQNLARIIDRIGKPVIAAVRGYALGGGCEVALMAHLRIASPEARFGQPEAGLGLIPGFGGTQRLARLVGEGRALDILLSGKPIDAEKALAIGLVNRIARERDVMEEAEALAGEIAKQGPVAVSLCLAAVRQGLQMPLDQALEHEAALFGLVFGTQDMREGTRAFLEKRPPSFQGC